MQQEGGKKGDREEGKATISDPAGGREGESEGQREQGRRENKPPSPGREEVRKGGQKGVKEGGRVGHHPRHS